MKLYLIIIFCCVMILSAILTLLTETAYLTILGLTVLAVVVVIAVDGLVSGVARMMPAKCAQHDRKIFTVSAKEKKFYEKLQIRKWKEKVPEIGHFTGFRKNKIADPKSVEYLDRFLLEACYGEIGHFFSLFFGFIILLLYPIAPNIWLPISIPVSIINVFLNLPSLFILRYNSYKLEILRASNLKKQRREELNKKPLEA